MQTIGTYNRSQMKARLDKKDVLAFRHSHPEYQYVVSETVTVNGEQHRLVRLATIEEYAPSLNCA